MRRPFRFAPKTILVALDDDLAKLRSFVPEGSRVLCLYGGESRKRSGVESDVRAALADVPFSEYSGISPNPDVTEIEAAAAQAREFGATLIVAAGGGSVMDAGKMVSVAALSNADVWTLATRGPKGANALPLIVVSTLAASGSETNAFATISNRSSAQKLVYQNENIVPRVAFIVPKYSRSLPQSERANGVVDAFVHVLESYLTYDVGAILHEELAESILRTLLRVGPLYYDNPEDLSAAEEVHLAAQFAQSGLLTQGVPEDWSTHFVAHEITAHFGLPHARALACALPWMLSLRQSRKAERLERMARVVFGAEDPTPESAILLIKSFFERLNVPWGERGITLNDPSITQLIDGLSRARRVRLGERLDIGLVELKEHLLKTFSKPPLLVDKVEA